MIQVETSENVTAIKTVQHALRSNFESETSEYINKGYVMLSAGFSENSVKGKSCWWAIMVKEPMEVKFGGSYTLEET